MQRKYYPKPSPKLYRRSMAPIGSIFAGNLFSKVGPLIRLHKDWPTIVGPDIAKNTEPYSLYGSLLTVNVVSSIWHQQLQFCTTQILKKLKAKKYIITKIRFHVAPITSSFKSHSQGLHHSSSQIPTTEVPFKLGDPMLHDALTKLYQKFTCNE